MAGEGAWNEALVRIKNYAEFEDTCNYKILIYGKKGKHTFHPA